jgi:hypothetical protein
MLYNYHRWMKPIQFIAVTPISNVYFQLWDGARVRLAARDVLVDDHSSSRFNDSCNALDRFWG